MLDLWRPEERIYLPDPVVRDAPLNVGRRDWWLLASGLEGRTWYSLSGTYHLAPTGSPTLSFSPACPGGGGVAYSYNGSSQYHAGSGNYPATSATQELTVYAWVRCTTGVSTFPLCCRTSTGATGFDLLIDASANLAWRVSDSAGNNEAISVVASANDSVWRFAAVVVKRASAARVFLNGLYIASSSVSFLSGSNTITPNAAMQVGGRGGANLFTGQVGECGTYGRGLSDADIRALYDASRANYAAELRRWPATRKIFLGTSSGTTVNLSGVTGTGTLGTLGIRADASPTLPGVTGAGVLGTLSPRADVALALAGVSGAAALGTLTYTASVTYTLTGVSGAGALGTFTVLSGTVVSLSGVTGTGTLGMLGYRADASPTLGGVSGTGAVGTFTVQTGGSVTVNLAGVTGIAALGTLTPSASATVILPGQTAAGVVGSLAVITGSSPPVAGYSQWLYAGQGTDVSGDGQAVGSWAGSGASPFTVSQGTAAKKPLLKLAAQNGLPVIRFDGVDDGLKAVVSLSQPMTVFIAYKMLAVGGGQKYVLGQGDTLDFVSNSASQVRIYGGSQVTASDATQTFFRVSTGVLSSQSGGNSYLYLNGVLVGSGNIGTNGLTTFRLCNYADGTTNNANADVGEVLIYPSALNSTDRSAVEAWMIARWIPSTTVVLTSVAATGVVGTFTIVGTGPPPDTWPAEAIPVDARATTAVVEARAVTVLVEVEQMDIPTVDRYGTDDLVYSFDFSRWLFLGSDPLASAVVTASPTGLTLSGVSIATGGKAALVRVQGGASGTTYTLTCVGTTQAGYDVTGQVQIVCA